MVSSDLMENLERDLISNGFPASALMEKVGLAMSSWFKQNPGLLKDGVLFLIGPGHNGGDGLVVARELHLHGVKVEIWCPMPISKSLTAQHLSYVNWLGIHQLQNPPDFKNESLWIEALFGLGQSRPLPTFLAQLMQDRERARPGKLVSLDLPAGISSDSGKPFSGGAAFASFTLSVGLVKKGLVQDLALPHVGRLVRIEMGFPKKLLENLPRPHHLRIISNDWHTANARWPKPSLNASKYQRGRVLVLAGSDQYPGAAWLALQGLLASGVGSIKAALPKQIADDLWKLAPEIVLAGSIEYLSNGQMHIGKALKDIELSRFDALLIGPGIGKDLQDLEITTDILKTFQGLLVLDADAINRLAFLEKSWDWLKKRKGPTWLTPHQAEFSRLFPGLQEECSCPLDAALKAAELTGADFLLKGAHSVIADSDGNSWQITETASWVARAGLGDLLAGFLTGVGALAIASEEGLSSEVLALAAFVHSQAGLKTKNCSSASGVANSLRELTIAFNR